jgi:flagellar biosynthesis/type III secretory pathway protein FliH
MHLSKYTVLKTDKTYSNIEDSWAKNEIAALTNKGIIDEGANFASNENVTREEFAGWISKAYGLDTGGLETDLEDLDPNSPYYDAIATAYQQGIISGKENGSFDPKGQVTKEEMAVMIASAMNTYDNPVNTDTFELAQYEEDLPTWAVNAVETVVENGAVDEEFFGSAEAVTREEAAAILYQVYR